MAKTKKTATKKKAPSRSPRKTQVEADAEPRILEAARAVFIRRGTAGARMQEIAREAGVNQALLHYYFRSKEALSNAVFEQVAIRLFPALLQTVSADVTLDEKIDRIVALYLDNMSRNPFLPGYLLAELHHHPERLPALLSMVAGADPTRMLPPIFKRLGAQIDAEVNAGRMRPIDPEQFVINLISLCIFPFAARPIVCAIFALDAEGFARFTDRRRVEIPLFFKNALRP